MSAGVVVPSAPGRTADSAALMARFEGMVIMRVDLSPDDQIVLTLRRYGSSSMRYIALVSAGDAILATEIRSGCRILKQIAAAKRRVEQANGVPR